MLNLLSKNRQFIAGLIMSLVILLTYAFAYDASAADSGYDFQTPDDLTVQGQEGTKNDADLEVKGVSSFAKDVYIESGMLAGPFGGIGRYENILLRSEDFSTTWSAANAALQANASSPTGIANGATTLTVATASPGSVSQIVTTTVTLPYTLSVWAKSGTGANLTLELTTDGSGPTLDTASFTLNSGWQRYSLTKSSGAGTGATTVTSAIKTTASVGQNILIWGAQLEQASSAGVYIKTTASSVTASRGMVSSDNLNISGNLQITGSGPHYVASGNVGIGTTGPNAKLQVVGSINATDLGSTPLSTSGNLQVTGTGAHYISQGNVGIGSTTPGAKLDVTGNIRSSTYVTANGLGEASAGAGGMNADYYHSATNDSWFAYPPDNANYIRGTTYIGNDTGVITTSGNVGIGTTSPGELLNVVKAQNAATKIKVQNSTAGTASQASLDIVSNSATLQLQAVSSTNSAADVADYIRLLADADASGLILHSKSGTGTIQFWTGNSDTRSIVERMRITTSGNVGIGTTLPAQKLDVAGTAKITGFQLGTSTTSGYVLTADTSGVGTWQAAAGGGGGWTDGGTNVYVTTTTDNVGIGTTGPGAKLDVRGAAAAGWLAEIIGDAQSGGTDLALRLKNNAAAATSNAVALGFSDATQNLGGIIAQSSAADSLTSKLYFIANSGVSVGNAGMVLQSNGNVGIGTTGPGYKLHILGSTNGDLTLQNTGTANKSMIQVLNSTLTYGGEFTQFDTTASGTYFGLSRAGLLVFGGTPQSAFALGTTNATPLVFATNGSEVVRIQSDGNVGIGTTGPGYKLHVVGDTYVNGNITKSGTVSFVQDNPNDPTKEIIYVCLEGGEAGTYVRGSAQLINGEAQVELPEHFSLVTVESTGLTCQISLIDECNGIKVISVSNSRFAVKELKDGKSNARFYYTVNGVRKGYENYNPIKDKLMKK